MTFWIEHWSCISTSTPDNNRFLFALLENFEGCPPVVRFHSTGKQCKGAADRECDGKAQRE